MNKEEYDDGMWLDYSNYKTTETVINLGEYNAYDDKGNKIETSYIRLVKEEYDDKKFEL